MLAAESYRPRRQHPFASASVHRGKSIAPQEGHAAADGRVGPLISPAAVIEVQLVTHDQATAANRLDVSPIPCRVRLVSPYKRPAVGPVPMETVAAVTQQDLIALLTPGRPRIALPDREQPQHQTLVRHRVEIVQLWVGAPVLRVGVARIEPIGDGPRHHAGQFLHQELRVRVLRIVTGPAIDTASNAAHPHLAERIVEDG